MLQLLFGLNHWRCELEVAMLRVLFARLIIPNPCVPLRRLCYTMGSMVQVPLNCFVVGLIVISITGILDQACRETRTVAGTVLLSFRLWSKSSANACLASTTCVHIIPE